MMASIDWEKQINFASALLLHSCLTVLVKELCNSFVLIHRLTLKLINNHLGANPKNPNRTSAILDAYTSVFSKDADGELAELYYTNTGAILLSATLASSVAMNLYLDDAALNGIIVGTFCFCFIASLAVSKRRITILIVALRRAGRFIWADTPFVNFFTLIYIATALRGSPTIRVKDYVAFRSIAVLELLFMKAKLAACCPEEQQIMMERLIQSEVLVTRSLAKHDLSHLNGKLALSRESVAAFQTYQRLSSMFFKTTVGYAHGCVSGAAGPCFFPLPDIGHSILVPQGDLRICRPSHQVVVIADCQNLQPRKNMWSRFIAHAHGVLLRRLGKVRVVYLICASGEESGTQPLRFRSNVNLVTGVRQSLLDEFPEQNSERRAFATAG